MSDTRGDLTLPDQDAGALFRAEMWLTNFFLGYWRHILAVVVVVLIGILIVGQYNGMQRRQQRAMTAEIAEEWASLPSQAIPGQLTDAQTAEIQAVADRLETLAAGYKGTAAAEAYLKTAELYRMLGDKQAQRTAFERAAPYGRGALRFAARSGLANLDLEEGKGDEALVIYRDLADEMDGFLAQQATLSLAVAQAYLGRESEARATLADFLGRWSDSPLAEEAQERLDRLGSGAPVEEAPPVEPAAEIVAPEPAGDEAPGDDVTLEVPAPQ